MFTFDNKQRILSLFLENPSTEYHLREIARNVRLSPAGVSKILKALVLEKLVVKEKTEIKDNYRSNVESSEFMSLKLAYNIYKLKSSGLVEYLNESFSPDAVILFGSFARGDNHINSDIDIALINVKEKSIDLKRFEEALRHTINIHCITFSKATSEFKNNIINGIILKGYLKVF
jgi:predicted nucleotidyltransferase